MVNAWSLAASILNGTFDKDYPIMKKKEVDEKTGLWKEPDPVEHSDAYYDYKRNDPNAENPFTDPVDQARADGLDYENTLYEYENSSGDDYMADVDDQRAHHFSYYDHGFTLQAIEESEKKKMAHYFKYHEEEILKDIEEYVSRTYQGHYTGNSHEFRNVQTLDLMAAKELASGFCQANILKYGSRYGNKDGRNTKDLMKVIHYAMLLLHFDGHYGEPSMSKGNIDQIDHNMP